ncbi:YihY/virulence factor BrkB family protein [soil metagenome]
MERKKKITLKEIWYVLKHSFAGFSDDKLPKLSAALAYYTIFSIGPLIIVIIFLASFFFKREAVEGGIYGQIKGFVGSEAAVQLQEIIKNASLHNAGYLPLIIGVITLLFGATTVFSEIQDSINQIWGLKAKPKLGIKLFIKNRLLSFGVIASLGFLLLVSLGVSAIVDAIGARLQNMLPQITVIMLYIVNLLITFLVTTILFAVIFKVLPDANVRWKDVWAGSFTTALLFMIGKLLISLYIAKSNIGMTYGTAGSFVIFLIWVYYSAIILYFGAEFTKAWAINYHHGIKPSPFAVIIDKEQTECPDQKTINS